mmetsp:Transcript_97363/g.251749  ORF Transcript_97363/g.251749 Transcript_97363/m.251749 type:complete len:339 (-) Transcript_97363:214-1230(-)
MASLLPHLPREWRCRAEETLSPVDGARQATLLEGLERVVLGQAIEVAAIASHRARRFPQLDDRIHCLLPEQAIDAKFGRNFEQVGGQCARSQVAADRVPRLVVNRIWVDVVKFCLEEVVSRHEGSWKGKQNWYVIPKCLEPHVTLCLARVFNDELVAPHHLARYGQPCQRSLGWEAVAVAEAAMDLQVIRLHKEVVACVQLCDTARPAMGIVECQYVRISHDNASTPGHIGNHLRGVCAAARLALRGLDILFAITHLLAIDNGLTTLSLQTKVSASLGRDCRDTAAITARQRHWLCGITEAIEVTRQQRSGGCGCCDCCCCRDQQCRGGWCRRRGRGH